MDIRGVESLMYLFAEAKCQNAKILDFTIWYKLNTKDGRIVHPHINSIRFNKEERVIIITHKERIDGKGITDIQIIPLEMIQSIEIKIEEAE